MEVLRREGQYDRLSRLGKSLQDMQSKALTDAGIAHRVCGDPTLFDIYFTDAECVDYRSARHRDPAQHVLYNNALRKAGVFKSPGKLYPSLALSEVDLEFTREGVTAAVLALASQGS